jgi:hypothetical protein
MVRMEARKDGYLRQADRREDEGTSWCWWEEESREREEVRGEQERGGKEVKAKRAGKTEKVREK